MSIATRESSKGTKFILTRELGRLAKWLRLLGFDAAYLKEGSPSQVIMQALREDRLILARRKELFRHRGIRIMWLKSEQIKEQLGQLREELGISIDEQRMFSRCIVCNRELVPVAKGEVKDKVPAYVFQTQESFTACAGCQRIYWSGTHWGNAKEYLRKLGIENNQ